MCLKINFYQEVSLGDRFRFDALEALLCGIAGVITSSARIDIHSALNRATSIQAHRGPDANGTRVETDRSWEVGFAHQRLAILDLSDLGAQPMESITGCSSIVYNGEVYNFKEIREGLVTQNYVSNTDTEVVLNALEENGIFNASNLFNGMWAFAWHDRSNSKVYLCRDRVGVKPFYYYQNNDGFYFSSELKTILEISNEKFELNYQVVGEYCASSARYSTSTMYKESSALRLVTIWKLI